MAGIFDAFTGNAQSDAQANARSFLQDIRGETAQEIGQGLERGLGYLQGAIQPQLDALGGGFNLANQIYGGYGNQAIGALQQGTGWGVQSIHDMLQPAVEAQELGYSRAWDAWEPTAAASRRYGDERALAAEMSKSGLGLTDPAMARAAFRTSPGYEFMLGEGLESIARNANRAGMLASGNQMRESQTYGSGLADKEWDDWMNRLFQREGLYAPLELQGASAAGAGRAGAALSMANKLGDLYSGAGRSLADIQTGYGKAAGNVYAQQARDLANMAAQKGGAEASVFGTLLPAQAEFLRQLLGLKTQANTALATGQAQSFVGQGDAEAAASKNIINAALGVGNLLTRGFGFGGSSPTAASSTSI